MKGNTGKIINIDLTEGSIQIETLPDSYYVNFIGGSGLAAKLFLDRGNFDAAPLSPEALLMFMNGPMAGVKLPGASRNSAAAISPLTGIWADASCGGYFAPELRFAGYDGIILTGKAKSPVLLFIEDDTIKLIDAAAYWGKTVFETHHALKDAYGKDFRTVLIGPAGENLVHYAAIVNEEHHVFGRAGMGAVMGSKNLKAIIVKGTKKTLDVADPEKFETVRKELLKGIREFPINHHTHEHGSAGGLQGGMQIGDVPVKNWTSNFNEEMGKTLDGPTLTATYLTKRGACQFCSIACKRVVEIKDGPFAIPEGPGPEYETIVALGSLLDSGDLAAACKAGRLCNDLGMDTISAGAALGWAMEAFEKGHLKAADMDGVDLPWGDMEKAIAVLIDIAYRRGKLADLLADGTAQAAYKVGQSSIDYSAVGKGMDAPMHDPRGGGHGLALTYAVGPRGACHVATSMLFYEMGLRYAGDGLETLATEARSGKFKANLDVVAQTLGAIKNSSCWCHFADLSLSLQDHANLFNTVAGYGWTVDDMMRAGRRVYYLKRLINYKFGMRAANDTLTARMLETARDGAPAGTAFDLPQMVSEFYDLMGIDHQSGLPKEEIVADYNLTQEVRQLGIAV